MSAESTAAPVLPPLPAHPADLAWPTLDWPQGPLPAQLDAAAFEACTRALTELPASDGVCQALLVVHRGRLVFEHYGAGVDADTTLQSWSMAKSMLHALTGMLVADGRLDPDAPAGAREWQAPGDPRARIRIRDLLRMRPGLAFVEDYVDEGSSDVMEMLWGTGRDDVAHYAAAQPLAHPPGTVFNYSSGTSNILARRVGETVGDGATGMERFMRERLFAPLGMRSPQPKFDARGTWKGSSFCFCSARDFARFGLLYLRDGIWDDRRLLPPGWVDDARTPTHLTAEEAYGSHWWVDPSDPRHFYASGYRGQRILVAPEKDLVAIRIGLSPNERVPALMRPLHDLTDAFPDL
ncbi:MAG TPA: serine hydrolase [Pseudomonadales bacterium]|nr:serine hydrolase [Pseudomonadales bacterium]